MTGSAASIAIASPSARNVEVMLVSSPMGAEISRMRRCGPSPCPPPARGGGIQRQEAPPPLAGGGQGEGGAGRGVSRSEGAYLGAHGLLPRDPARPTAPLPA